MHATTTLIEFILLFSLPMPLQGGLLESLFIVDIVTIITTLIAVTSLNMMTENSASAEIKEKYGLEAKSLIMTVALVAISLQKSIIGIGVLFRPLGCLVPIPTYLLANREFDRSL